MKTKSEFLEMTEEMVTLFARTQRAFEAVAPRADDRLMLYMVFIAGIIGQLVKSDHIEAFADEMAEKIKSIAPEWDREEQQK